jgi:hypothetical protein
MLAIGWLNLDPPFEVFYGVRTDPSFLNMLDILDKIDNCNCLIIQKNDRGIL